MIFQQEKDFLKFRKENKHMRFLEALKLFAGVDKIIYEKDGVQHDTFYWQDIKIK